MQAAKNIRQRKKVLGSYPYASVIFSITLALFVLGVFGILTIYSSELKNIVHSNIRIQVYLENDLSPTQHTQIRQNLMARSFTNRLTRDDAVMFVSKEEAAEKFIKETGEEFKQFLGENPLRDAFLVKIKPEYHDTTAMRGVKTEIEQIGGVFEAHYVANVIESINRNMTRIGFVLLGIVVLLLVTVVFLINHSIRLAIYSQRFLIRSMQLVGATKWFIQRAFLLRSLVHGFISGLLSLGLIAGLVYMAEKRIPDLTLLNNNELFALLGATLMVLGIMVAIISTWRSVNKYQGFSLDELH